jgi:hypothetical protein
MRFATTKYRLRLAAVLSMSLAGCATVGKPIPASSAKEIQIGTTTRQQIQARFGDPWRTGIEDGRQSWTFGYYHISLFGKADAEDLVVVFDQNGVVSSYKFNTNREDSGK